MLANAHHRLIFNSQFLESSCVSVNSNKKYSFSNSYCLYFHQNQAYLSTTIWAHGISNPFYIFSQLSALIWDITHATNFHIYIYRIDDEAKLSFSNQTIPIWSSLFLVLRYCFNMLCHIADMAGRREAYWSMN